MRKTVRNILVCAVATMVIVLVFSAVKNTHAQSPDRDDDRSSHEELLEYHRSQDILTFEEILKIIRSDFEGEIIEIEFEIEGGIPIYEIKYINAEGQVLEMYMDAKTGAFFEEEPE